MILQQIRERAAADLQHIILPEGEDIRTVTAAAICAAGRIARITILGDEEKIRSLAAGAGAVPAAADSLRMSPVETFGTA